MWKRIHLYTLARFVRLVKSNKEYIIPNNDDEIDLIITEISMKSGIPEKKVIKLLYKHYGTIFARVKIEEHLKRLRRECNLDLVCDWCCKVLWDIIDDGKNIYAHAWLIPFRLDIHPDCVPFGYWYLKELVCEDCIKKLIKKRGKSVFVADFTIDFLQEYIDWYYSNLLEKEKQYSTQG